MNIPIHNAYRGITTITINQTYVGGQKASWFNTESHFFISRKNSYNLINQWLIEVIVW